MGEKNYGIVGRQSLRGDPLLSTCQNCQLLGNHCTTMVAKPGLLSSSASRSTSSTQTCKHRFESNTYSDTDMHGPKSKFSATCLALGPAGWTHRCQVWCLRPGGLCKSVSDAPNSKQSLHHPIQGVVLKLKNWKGPMQNNSHNKDCSHCSSTHHVRSWKLP